ncbi:MAG: competence/damage-inducible protein A [Clostridia bacterium]|nr:competence/damage-inducible protein A [Clostridia bacterium]
MIAEILAVGTELLLGDVHDTNSTYLSQQLAQMGISVCHRQTVGDNPVRLRAAIRLALSRADVVILCGGLGPTPDDLTKECACEELGVPLVLHEESLSRIRGYFERSGRVMSDNNQKQAMMPEGGVVFRNDHGTAPGCAVAKDGKHLLIFPGPPRELKPMFEQAGKAYLRPLCDAVLRSHTVRVFGLGESAAAAMVAPLLDSENPTVAPYAKAGEMYFRVTAKAHTADEADALCAPMLEELCRTLGSAVYGVDVPSLEQAVVTGLADAHKTVATAESCTGGLVSERLTSVSGASAVFSTGVCAYSGEAKEALLGVPHDVIAQTGTVSADTAVWMARGVRARANADIGVSVTGSAGPTPCEGKPVGTVFVALSAEEGDFVRALNLTHRTDRDYIRTVAASHALDMVRKALGGDPVGERYEDHCE